MEQIRTLFFDSYAFFEILNGNLAYEPYTKEISIITTKLNLMELHYGLLRKEGKEKAEEFYEEYLKFVIDFSDEDIKEANQFRLEQKKQDLSYIDCLGYILAKKRGIKFLTGDGKFKDLANVEFVE